MVPESAVRLGHGRVRRQPRALLVAAKGEVRLQSQAGASGEMIKIRVIILDGTLCCGRFNFFSSEMTSDSGSGTTAYQDRNNLAKISKSEMLRDIKK